MDSKVSTTYLFYRIAVFIVFSVTKCPKHVQRPNKYGNISSKCPKEIGQSSNGICMNLIATQFKLAFIMKYFPPILT